HSLPTNLSFFSCAFVQNPRTGSPLWTLRFSVMSDTDSESIFMEPIHLSSAVAARKIISEELKPRKLRVVPVPESMRESARQLMVEDLYKRVKDMMDDTSSYNTPCVMDIQRAMVQDRLEAPLNPVDEVWPNIFIGEKTVAVNKSRLKRMGITHILNAAHGTGVYTSQDFYEDLNIQYLGIEVDDFLYVDIYPHFRKAAEFLDDALLTHKGKVLVNSVMGISRSAVLVTAYLMIFHHMTIMEALLALRKKRPICPNEGFLKQLRQLNEALLHERDMDDYSDTLSQCFITEVHSSQEEKESSLGAQVHSFSEEEEKDGESTMSSRPPMSHRCALREQISLREDQTPTMPEQQRVHDGTERMICDWQQSKEKYLSSEDWLQAQLMTDDEASLLGGGCHLQEDLESASGGDIQNLKEQVGARGIRRRTYADSISTDSGCGAGTWRHRLRESKEQAANEYEDRGQGGSNKTGGKSRQDEESLLSEASSHYSVCMKNKDTVTPLERWRLKQDQFGLNEKDIETKQTTSNNASVSGAGNIEGPVLEDGDLTAYQTWKMKKQQRLSAMNKDETMELSRGQNSTSVKRKQHREEIEEFSHSNLEESQSKCGCDREINKQQDSNKTNSNMNRQLSFMNTSRYPEFHKVKDTKLRASRYSSFDEQATESSVLSIRRENNTSPEEQLEKSNKLGSPSVEEPSSSSQLLANSLRIESRTDVCSEGLIHSELPQAEDLFSNRLAESKTSRIRRSHTDDLEEQKVKWGGEDQDCAVKRKFTHYLRYKDGNTEVKRGGQVEKEKEEDIPFSISQHRMRSRAQAGEDQSNDIPVTTRRR
ncbi:hypothetical protein JZ751_028087, partial [Albula glossodonta]